MAIRPLTIAPQLWTGGTVAPQVGYVGSSQTFKEGSLLILSSQQLVIATTTPTGGLVGVAAQDAPTTQGAVCQYYPLLPGLILEASLAGATSGALALAAAILQLT